MNRRLLIGFISVLIILVSVYLYIMYGGKRNLANEKSIYTITTQDLSKEYIANIDASNTKYLEKAVAVTGKVVGINGNQVQLENAVVCNFNTLEKTIKVDDLVTIKGRIVGYDDLMEEIKLDQCFIDKSN